MRLITKNMNGNIHDVAAAINKLQLVRFLMSITPVNSFHSVVLFRVESYGEYHWFCEKFGDVPLSRERYFE